MKTHDYKQRLDTIAELLRGWGWTSVDGAWVPPQHVLEVLTFDVDGGLSLSLAFSAQIQFDEACLLFSHNRFHVNRTFN